MQSESADPIMTLPGRYYTDPAIYQQELDHIFYTHWLCPGRVEQIAQPGQYALFNLGRESIILLHGRDGVRRAFHNVCRHRGSRLCTAPAGQLPHTLQCPYHAWTYAHDGQLIGAPHMNEDPTFDRHRWPLQPVPLVEWEGFLFINLAPRPEPFTQAFAPLLGKFSQWQLPNLRIAGHIDYQVAANWKLIFENYNECYHCPGVHPALAQRSPYRSGQNDLTEGPFLGGPSLLNHDQGSLTLSGAACAPVIGSIGGEDLHRVYYYSIFPNMLLSLHPDYVMAHTIRPDGPGRVHIRCEWLFDPAAATRPGYNPDDAIQFWDATNRQDWEVCELSQLGISSRAYTPGPYSPLETIPAAFDRAYLAALAQPPATT